MKIHELKTWPVFFQAVLNGTKTFEVRKNDRDFKIGDRLDLMEYDPDAESYTGAHCHPFISYILGLNPFIDLQGNVILGFKIEQPSAPVSGESLYKCDSCGNVWTFSTGCCPKCFKINFTMFLPSSQSQSKPVKPEPGKSAKSLIDKLIWSDEAVLDTVGEDIRFVSVNDAIQAMEEYASQYRNQPSVQDTESPLTDEVYVPYFGWCDVKGCKNEGSGGGIGWRDTGYWTLCMDHHRMEREGKKQPEMKPEAIERESRRDKKTGWLIKGK